MNSDSPAMLRAIVVVPTIREQHIREFLAAWKTDLSSAQILVVEDHAERSFDLGHYDNVTHFSWEDIDDDLGTASWIIPRKTDCVRSYGLYKAFQSAPDLIVTLDDDCYPDPNGRGFLQQHWARIQQGGQEEAWWSTGQGVMPRGVPYYARARHWPCVLNHGLWSEVPDYDAPTRLSQARTPGEFIAIEQTIPVGRYYPMCGMNIAFLPVIAPAMYFMLMGASYPFDRFGDIWCGVIAKRIADHLGYAINSGSPSIVHRCASNVWDNLQKEAVSLRLNEELWAAVDAITLTGTTVADCYRQIAARMTLPTPFLPKLQEAMCQWAELFQLAPRAGQSVVDLRDRPPRRVSKSANGALQAEN